MDYMVWSKLVIIAAVIIIESVAYMGLADQMLRRISF